MDGFDKPAHEPCGVHVDQIQRLILMESLQVIEQVASGLEQLQATCFVKHLRRVAGSDVVVVFVIAEFFEAVSVGGCAVLRDEMVTTW